MRTILLGAIVGVCAVLWAGIASAQTATAYDFPAPIPQTYNNSNSFSLAAQDANAPPAPTAKPTDQAAEKKDAEKKDEEKADEENKDEDKPWKLFDCCWLDEHRIDVRGWLDQGIALNSASPADRFNGPVGYNDRSNEYMLNQLYLITERTTKVEGDCGTDWGFRVDLLYGEDRRYTTAAGLDSTWNDDERFYGLSMPQMYVDLAVNKWIFRIGHMLAPCGYESVMAPENFFYSHSYSFLYGQPTTITAAEGMYKIDDQWTANGGLFTGWNDWTDETNRVNYFGGFNWTSKDDECHKDKKQTFLFETFLGNTDANNPSATRFHYDIVFTQQIGPKWQFALENNYGYDSGIIDNGNGTFRHGTWADIAPYLIYTIDDCWSAGFRYEWFDDDGGAVVETVGPPALGPYPGNFQACTWGLNWKPAKDSCCCLKKNILVRSELRYDWANNTLPAGQRPFDDGQKNQQFLWSTDLIVRF